MAKLSPSQGGCWFCQMDNENEEMFFENEFDTFVHLSCLRSVLDKNPDHPEAQLMSYLLRT